MQPGRQTANDATPESKTRLRIRFTKCGDLRWISHRDLARVWERLLRRAGLQLAFSQGFHPKPRINFPSALALGIEALDEVVELEVMGAVRLDEIRDSIRREMPVGMELLNLESPEYSLGKARVLGASYRIALPVQAADADADASSNATLENEPQSTKPPASLPDPMELQAKIDEILGRQTLEIVRDEKTIACDPNHDYFDLKIENGHLLFTLPNLANGSVRPSELLDCLCLGHLLEQGVTLQRTEVHLQDVPTAAPASSE